MTVDGDTRRQRRHAMLRQRACDERRDVRGRVADRMQSIGHAEPLHEPGDPIGENRHGVGILGAADVGAPGVRRLQMAAGTRNRGKAEEDRWRVEDDRESVRDERVVRGVHRARRLLICPDTGYDMPWEDGRRHCRIRHPHTTRQDHLLARLVVGRILDGANEVLRNHPSAWNAQSR